ncbi:CRISPR-associated protein Cas4 [Enterococcus sp. LJL120]
MRITGNMINYYFVCQRKLWLFSKGLKFEDENENVQLGKLLEQESYKNQRKQILFDGTINIDFLENWRVLHEVKKSKAIEPAAVWQLKYYLYYLQKHGLQIEHGYIDYPKIRERVEVTLDADDSLELQNILRDVEKLVLQSVAPIAEKKPICPKCAYYEYCFS